MLELMQQYDGAEEWTRLLRYVPPRLPVGVAPAAPEAALRWVRESPRRFRLYRAVAAGEAVASAEQYLPQQAGLLLQAGESPEEARALAWGFGRGLLLVSYDGMPPVPRFFDGKKAATRIAQLPPAVRKDHCGFGFGFRVGMVVNEFYPQGDDLIARGFASFPQEVQTGFAKGLGAGYRMRFLHPPNAQTQSPGASRLESLMPPHARAAFRAGLAGEQ
jgi:hypothetical protein